MLKSSQLPDVDIWMRHSSLGSAPIFSMPDGYHMRFYREGDVPNWVQIQQASDPFYKATARTFLGAMPGEEAYLAHRVMFLVGPDGRDIGTITAWQNNFLTGKLVGQIHWVAIITPEQSKGLAKPMMSAVCQQLKVLGHQQACLSTNTKRIPALNLYLKFGFEPYFENNDQKDAWKTIESELK